MPIFVEAALGVQLSMYFDYFFPDYDRQVLEENTSQRLRVLTVNQKNRSRVTT
jgi:hypothetical protein